MTDSFSDKTPINISEHTVTRVMAGNIESVRQHLAMALEQLGYRVTSETPLRARHGARGSAAYFMSANALDFPTIVEINFKPQGQGATQVTFDYQVKHGAFGKGERQTLTREVEAIIALAAQRSQALHCAGCGVEVAADTRFCRKCGAPVKTTVPAELEVMRLTAGARAGYQWTWFGAVFLASSWLMPLLMLLVNGSSGVGVILQVIWVSLIVLGFWALGAGLRRTHHTLNPPSDKEELRLPTYSPTPIAAPITNELPPVYRSITEGTTDLLPMLNEVEAIPRQKDRSQA